MSQVARLNTKTYIITTGTSAITWNAQGDGDRYDYAIIKNEAGSAGPVMAKTGSTAALAEAVYPTAGTDATVQPQTGKTVLPGHSETYRKKQESDWMSLVSTGVGTVHVTLGCDP